MQISEHSKLTLWQDEVRLCVIIPVIPHATIGAQVDQVLADTTSVEMIYVHSYIVYSYIGIAML